MKKAFTLVELLVVVGILGILIAVLLGTFSGAGESARAAKCQANLHALAQAVQSYAMTAAYNKFPKAGAWIHPKSVGKDEQYTFINPYDSSDSEEREKTLKEGKLWEPLNGARECYYCPTHQVYAREHNIGGDPLWSYAMNKGAGGRVYGSVSRADRLLLFAELPFAAVKNGEFVQTGQLSDEELDPILDPPNSKGDGGDEVIGFNHKNGKNLFAHVCYADGHVAKLMAPKTGEVKDLTMWLCQPTEDGVDIDISFDGKQYRKNDATE